MSADASVVRRWIQAGVVLGVVVVAVALIGPAIQRAREAACRTQSRNNLKQIGLAFENYHDAYQVLPYGGIFDERGTAFHGWTSALAPLLAQRPVFLDPKVPWDDPLNIDHIIHEFAAPFQNPSIAEEKSPDGLPLAHYAANQTLFHRNSVIRWNDVPNRNATALVGDCQGDFVPIGYPYNWRDFSLGIGTSAAAFGCPTRDVTMILMADHSIRLLNNRVDVDISRTLVGPAALKPGSEQVAKPGTTYRLKNRDYWRYLHVVRGHKTLMSCRLAPDRKFLGVHFGHYDDPHDADPRRWRKYFDPYLAGAPVQHVEIDGDLRADELAPFLQLPTLRRLTISRARIVDGKEAVLATARKGIVVD